MNRETRVGVVGAGYVCAHHLRALCDLGFVRVVGICDLDEEAGGMALRFGVGRVCRALEEMADERPEVGARTRYGPDVSFLKRAAHSERAVDSRHARRAPRDCFLQLAGGGSFLSASGLC